AVRADCLGARQQAVAVGVERVEHAGAAGPFTPREPSVSVPVEFDESILPSAGGQHVALRTASADAELDAGQDAVTVPVLVAERSIVAAPFLAGDDPVAVQVHLLKPDGPVGLCLRHSRQAEAQSRGK